MTETTPRDLMIGCIEEKFSITYGPAAVIAAIIHEEFDKLETVVKDATEAAQERIDEGNGEYSDDLDTLMYKLMLEEIATYLDDFTYNDGRGNTGHVYELSNGQDFEFGQDSHLEKEAMADCSQALDDQISAVSADLNRGGYHDSSSFQWLKDNVIDSWARGISREDWIEANAQIDNLARYDGNYHTVWINGGMWHWFRTN